MENNRDYFDSNYVDDTGTKISSERKEDESKSVEEYSQRIETQRYGIGKPIRKIIRAKLIDG